jgi:hypothetical protein
MSVSIIACPSCKALVLPDTAQCPNCQFVFDERRAADGPPSAAAVESTEEEVPCPGCNELVRKGLVRCWNCGTFMQEEIAETYRRMQVAPPRVIYSEVERPATEGTSVSGDATDPGRMATPDAPEVSVSDLGDADFELAPVEDLDGDFDLGTASPPTAPNEILQSAPTFALRTEAEQKGASSATESAATKDQKPPEGAATTAPAAQEFTNEFQSRFGVDEQADTGEGLLRVALAEEAETGSRRRSQKLTEGGMRSGFNVFCPNGHRIKVQERFRGMTGRCPRCREPFSVPGNTWDEVKAQKEEDAQKAAAIVAAVAAHSSQAGAGEHVEVSAGEYTRWLLDSHFHVVDLTKLKLKPGSLLNDFQDADVGFAPDGMLIVTLVKKGGLFGGGAKKKLSTRDAVLDHLSKGKGRSDLPAPAHHFFAANVVSQIRVVQPIVSAEHSMFAGVAVFGAGRFAVRLPKLNETANPEFLSFALSEFRRFSKILEEFYGIKSFGQESRIPLEDVFTERYCHFSDQLLRILENVDSYQGDPGFNLKLIGYKCASCGLVVGEEAREKEKIGGKGGKKLAKAQCPKCQKPFGNLPLYTMDSATPVA